MTNRNDGIIAAYSNSLQDGGGVLTGPLGLADEASAPAGVAGQTLLYSSGGTPYAVDPSGTRHSMISPSVEQSSASAGAVCETHHRYTIVGTATPTTVTPLMYMYATA